MTLEEGLHAFNQYENIGELFQYCLLLHAIQTSIHSSEHLITPFDHRDQSQEQ